MAMVKKSIIINLTVTRMNTMWEKLASTKFTLLLMIY